MERNIELALSMLDTAAGTAAIRMRNEFLDGNDAACAAFDSLLDTYRGGSDDEGLLTLTSSAKAAENLVSNWNVPITDITDSLERVHCIPSRESRFFNLRYTRLIVKAIIRDDSCMYLCEKKGAYANTEPGKLHMFGGKVRYPKDPSDTLGDAIISSLVRELREEVNCPMLFEYLAGEGSLFRSNVNPLVITGTGYPISVHSIGVIYDIHIPGMIWMDAKEEKLSVNVVPYGELYQYIHELDPWIVEAIYRSGCTGIPSRDLARTIARETLESFPAEEEATAAAYPVFEIKDNE